MGLRRMSRWSPLCDPAAGSKASSTDEAAPRKRTVARRLSACWIFSAACAGVIIVGIANLPQLMAADSDDEAPVSESAPVSPRAVPKKSPLAAPLSDKTPAAGSIAAGSKELPWSDSLARGYTQAERTRKPLFVRAGSETCRFCRALAATIAKPAVQEELQRWTLVEIDIDKAPDDARQLAVGPIPALRLVTATGRLAAETEGALSADDLVAWLQ